MSSEVWTWTGRDPGLNGARGTYVNPSNFAARATTIFNNGANHVAHLNYATNPSLSEPVGFANQQMVTADSVGANTPVFLTSISPPRRLRPARANSTKWGFWSIFNGQTRRQRHADIRGSGPSHALGRRRPVQDVPGINIARGTATYTGHAIASIANPNNDHQLSSRGRVSEHGQTSELVHGAVNDHRPRRNELHRHGQFYLPRRPPGRSTFNGTPLAGSM